MTVNHHNDVSTATRMPRMWSPAFPPETEALYRAHIIEQDHKHVAVAWLICVCLLNSFIVSDFILAQPYLTTFLVGRLLVMTPAGLITAAFLWRKSPFHEVLSVAPAVIWTGTILVLIAITEGDFRQHYLFGCLLIMMGGVVIGRPRPRCAVVAVGLQLLLYLMMLQHADFISEANKLTFVLFGTATAVVSMLAVSALDSASRRSFRLGLRIERLNQELAAQSLTDPLTKLANRRAFEQAAARHWSDPSLRAEPVSVVILDVDRFKLFNDSYGHSAGDACLTTVAACVTAGVPEGPGLAVRFGGEEMLLLLPATDFTTAREIAERIRLSILSAAIPHADDGKVGVVSASFGVATATAEVCTSAELVIRADTALYAAKNGGRNQVWPPLVPLSPKADARPSASRDAA